MSISSMRVITHTNIVVDDFGYCKSFPKNTFVHFLTHFHQDHWDGLTPLWDYSPIYCTEITANLVASRFPKLDPLIVRCEYYKEYEIEVGHGHLTTKFWMFDAKHIPGAAMILFEGYMGRVLFTGDFRYELAMVLENPILFPPELRTKLAEGSKNSSIVDKEWVEAQTGIALCIDQIVFDNTYCNEMFDFGTEETVFQKMKSIIDKHRGKRVLITLGALGKNRLLFKLSRHYQTLICISKDKLQQIEATKGETHIFTTQPDSAIIEVIKKKGCRERVEQEKLKNIPFICINTDFLMVDHHSPDGINFIVPYSVHSNYKEMSTFIKLIRPASVYKLVIPFETFKEIRYNKVVDNRLKLAKYLHKLERIHKSKSGFSWIVKHHTDIVKLSKEYLGWMYPERQEELMKALRIGKPDHSLRKKQLVFEEREYSNSGKMSLKDVAGELLATHNNRNLVEMVERNKEMKEEEVLEKIYNSIFVKGMLDVSE